MMNALEYRAGWLVILQSHFMRMLDNILMILFLLYSRFFAIKIKTDDPSFKPLLHSVTLQ
jgi:hypothetical protein